MNYLIGNIIEEVNEFVPSDFIKNEYSKTEYSLIKKGLHDFYNVDDFNVLYTKNGKPYLDNDIKISISHSKDLVIVVFSKEDIGVDLELKKSLTKGMKRLLNIPEKTKPLDSLIEFLKREAIIKLEGLTLSKANDLNINDYHFYIDKFENYYFVICQRNN